MALIFFCGDTHGQFRHLLQAVDAHRPDALVLLGDLTPPVPLHEVLAPLADRTEVWFIHGNHDTDSDVLHDRLWRSRLAARNLHGRVETIAGIRIAGLGGIFRGQVWSPPLPPAHASATDYIRHCGPGNLWRGGLPRKHRSTIFPDDYERLAREHADILVTHEAPRCHPHGFEAITTLAQRLGARTTFHGHHHDRPDYADHTARQGFRAFGVGLRGITDQDGRVITAGEHD